MEPDSANPTPSALLSTADVDFVQRVDDSIRDELAKGRDYGGLLTAVSRRVSRFQQDVMHVCRCAATIQDTPSWNPLECTQEDLTIQITGLAPDEQFQVTAASPKEASEIIQFVSALDAACARCKEIQHRCFEVSMKQQTLQEEQAGLKQSAEATVDEHIRLLRQYNKTKDIGQQLIGLIAESRGVPVGSLYRDGDYGVGTDD